MKYIFVVVLVAVDPDIARELDAITDNLFAALDERLVHVGTRRIPMTHYLGLRPPDDPSWSVDPLPSACHLKRSCSSSGAHGVAARPQFDAGTCL